MAGSATENVNKLSFASLQARERMQLSARNFVTSSDDAHRQRGVAMSITVSISATQSPTPDGDTEMSNNRRSLSLMLISGTQTTLVDNGLTNLLVISL